MFRKESLTCTYLGKRAQTLFLTFEGIVRHYIRTVKILYIAGIQECVHKLFCGRLKIYNVLTLYVYCAHISTVNVYLCSYWGSFQAKIEKPGTQNPGPGQVFKLSFVSSRTQKNNVRMWRNRHICTKFRKIVTFLEVIKTTYSKPGSVTSNLAQWKCDVLWRKFDVTSFRHRPSLEPRSRCAALFY